MTRPAVRSGAYLHHLCMESAAPERLANFYGDAMDMMVTKIGESEWRCEGPSRRIIVRQGIDRKLGFAALACRDRDGLEALRDRVLAEGISLEPSSSPYFGSDAFAVRDPDGHLICFGLAQQHGQDRPGLRAPLQHLTFASRDVAAFVSFYVDGLGFSVSDRVLHPEGNLATCFVTSNHEHHTVACFKSDRSGVDHHSYEAGEWIVIRDWCDRFGDRRIPLMWGPGRHGPGNNLFVFIEDPDRNWIEVSAELEVMHDRAPKDWPHEARTLNLWGKAILRS